MIKFAFSAVALILAATAAQAGEVHPLTAQSVSLADAAGNVYYTKEADGFRVVATISGSEGAIPVRFTAKLADGQSVVVSVPAEAGKPAHEVEILRTGDRVTVEPVELEMIRAAL